MEIQAFVSKVNFNALVDEFSNVSPIFKVPRAAVNLVDDDSIPLAALKKLEHFVKDWPASFGSCLSFFKPFTDLQSVVLCVAFDRITLFLKRDSVFALFSR
jgi:hypothetical protein